MTSAKRWQYVLYSEEILFDKYIIDSRGFPFEDDYTKLGEPWVENVGDLKQAKSSGKHLIFAVPTHAHLWREIVIL